MAKGRGLVQQQHGLYAEEIGKLQLRFELLMPSEGDEHPYDHGRPAKSRGQCWAVRARNCVTWKCAKQFPSYYGGTCLTMSARIRRAELLNDTHADYVNGDENDWIWFFLFVFSMFSVS